MIGRVRYAPLLRQFFKPVLVSSTNQEIECLFRLEHFLIVIAVEIAPEHNAFDRELCSFNHVIGLRTSAASLMRSSCCAAGVSFADPFGNHSRFQVVHLTVCAPLCPAIKRTKSDCG